MAKRSLDRFAVLHNGIKIPLLGLGCWQAGVTGKGEVEKAVEASLDCGYRHIDTAYNYLNEEEVGRGIHKWLEKSGSKREDIFIVTKLPMIGMYEGGIQKYLRLSLKKLKVAYVDLYLIHCPIGMKGKNDEDVYPFGEDGRAVIDEGTDLIAVWKEMEKMVELGLAKSIGVSNFNIKQMTKLRSIAKIPPTVNQVELHVAFQQKKMVDYCQKNDIVLTAYAPLGSPGRLSSQIAKKRENNTISLNLMSNPVVRLVADKHGVTPAQVLIRFWIQKGIVTIPKSVNPDRIKINSDVFSFILDEIDIAALLLLDRGEDGRTFRFMDYPGIKEHPES